MALKMGSRFKKAFRIIRDDGVLAVTIVVLQKIQKELHKKSHKTKTKAVFLVKPDDVLKAAWVEHPYAPSKAKRTPPYTINWVMSPPRSGGGHQNIFRFIKYLEDQGHTCRVYLYSVSDFATIADLRKGMVGSYPDTKAAMTWLDKTMEPADVVFATGWETAYPVFRDASKARKFYFVQDFEPSFYPVGSEYILAENTYRFNFHGITAGGWLAQKLSSEYGMSCDHYDFGANKELYRFTNNKKRGKVFFYARPVTARRGFELGILALETFHKRMPDYEIVLAGWDVSEYDISFPYENLKTLSLGELSDVYNECAAALVISLTNMSLLPLELLACGTIPVVNEGDNNRLVSSNPYIHYAAASPDALAAALISAVTREDLAKYAETASQSVAGLSWDDAGKKLVEAIEGQLHG